MEVYVILHASGFLQVQTFIFSFADLCEMTNCHFPLIEV